MQTHHLPMATAQAPKITEMPNMDESAMSMEGIAMSQAATGMSATKCQLKPTEEQSSIAADEDPNTDMDTFFSADQNSFAENILLEALFKMCPEAGLVRSTQKIGITEKNRGISKKNKTTTGTRNTKKPTTGTRNTKASHRRWKS